MGRHLDTPKIPLDLAKTQNLIHRNKLFIIWRIPSERTKEQCRKLKICIGEKYPETLLTSLYPFESSDLSLSVI